MSGTTKITAEASIEQLPTDVKTLQQMVLTLLGQIDDLSGQLYYLKRQLFGKKSEKLDPAQRRHHLGILGAGSAGLSDGVMGLARPQPGGACGGAGGARRSNQLRSGCSGRGLFLFVRWGRGGVWLVGVHVCDDVEAG
mgnify:CR=1 FL=1